MAAPAKMAAGRLVFTDMFKAIDQCLRFAGLFEYYTKKKSSTKTFRTAQWIFFCLTYTNITLQGSWEVVYGILLKEDDFTEWILQEAELCPCSIVSIYSVIKTFIMLINRKTLHALVEKLREMWPKEEDDPELYKLYQDNIAWTQKFCAFYVKLTTLAGLMYNTFPFFTMATSYYTTGEYEYILPYYVWYPFGFDPTKTLTRYAITYCTHFVAGFYVCPSMACNDAIFCTLLAMITVHFTLLCKKLRNLCNNSEKRSVAQVKESLKRLVDYHNTLIELTKDAETVYGFILLMTLVGSSFLICILVFSVSIAPGARIIRYVSLLTSTLSQITMMSYYGDWLLQESDGVSDAIYESDWPDLGNPELNKDIVMIIKRTYRRVGVGAMGFSVFSMTTLTSILGGAWTYFSLINTMYEQT